MPNSPVLFLPNNVIGQHQKGTRTGVAKFSLGFLPHFIHLTVHSSLVPTHNPHTFRCATRRSVASRTSKCTCARTPASARSSATFASRDSRRSPVSTRTNAYTRVSHSWDEVEWCDGNRPGLWMNVEFASLILFFTYT